MIVKVIPPGPGNYGRALASYVLNLKREHQGEHRGEYALDLRHGGEKVEWARTVNTKVDEPRWGIEAIERHNARNTRQHKVSRYEHIVVSFPKGEKPTREQMAIIEDRLMKSIGFGDHPRVSAVHKPDGRQVDNWHLHIAVSRISPTIFNQNGQPKALHPRGNHFTLQAEAGRLELELGLTQERKTVLARERHEIDCLRRHLDRDPPSPASPGQQLASIHEAHARVTAIAVAEVKRAEQVAVRIHQAQAIFAQVSTAPAPAETGPAPASIPTKDQPMPVNEIRDAAIASERREMRRLQHEHHQRWDQLGIVDRLAHRIGWREDQQLTEIDRETGETRDRLDDLVTERLNEMSSAELVDEANIMRAADGTTMTVDMIAREQSPAYADLARRDVELGREVQNLDRSLASMENRAVQLLQMMEDRIKDWGVVRSVLHETGVWRDRQADLIKSQFDQLRENYTDTVTDRQEKHEAREHVKHDRNFMFQELKAPAERELGFRQERVREALQHMREREIERDRTRGRHRGGWELER